jgi:uncharacterized membrane protein
MRVQRTLAPALTLGALLWSATIVAAPHARRSGYPLLTAAADSVYQGASHVCHQRSSRSFHAGGIQQPVCARCAGLYLSGAFGALAAWAGRRRPAVPRRTRATLVIAAVPTVLTFGLEFIGLSFPSNATRALAAFPLGAAAGWVFVRSLRAESGGVRPPSHAARQPRASAGVHDEARGLGAAGAP